MDELAALASELREIAVEAARVGGRLAKRAFTQQVAIRLKSDRSEVTEIDEAAQAAVIDVIRRARPQDAIIAEEGLTSLAGAQRDARVVWVIDPLDGTRNYVRGIPYYACSVGALAGGRPIAGAIHEPERDCLYAAAAGGPLLVNGVEMAPQTATSPRKALNLKPVVALPSSPSGPLAALTRKWLDHYICRGFGATALHLAWVAAGALDAALCDNARLWDIAAGLALLHSAGCPVTTVDGSPLTPLAPADYRGEELPLVTSIPALWPTLIRM
jgi:myo-inositol-1(or 4)-monophosphatase